jgi:DNA-binding CsgD family transcriptional regulator
MELLERGSCLGALDEYAADATSGRGRLVLVTGEAGIGKTAVIDAFRAAHPELTWMWGACDGGFTPRPLGPLHEIASGVGGRLRELCREDADRNELFTEFLATLASAPSTPVVVVEDLHWADEATLDWLGHLSRRVGQLRALVLLTYRDDEPDDDVLTDMMGRIASHGSTRRIVVPPLSLGAVQRVAGGTDPAALHTLTGGNPFYLGEVLAIGSAVVPPSVTDVVRARVQHHSPPAQRILAAAAILARPAPAASFAAVAGVPAMHVDECVASGTLVPVERGFAFRHELTRRAVEQGVPGVQAAELHRIALLALEQEGADVAELTHHAVGSGDVEAVLRHAPMAGRVAAESSAHREATIQFGRALRYADRMDAQTNADLEEALANSLSTRDEWAEAEEHWQTTIALRRNLDDTEALARCLRRYALCLWRLCRADGFREKLDEAWELLRDGDDSAERAQLLYLRSSLTDLPPDVRAGAVEECARIAKDLGEESLAARALLARGYVDGHLGVIDFGSLEEALETAIRAGDEQLTAGCYVNLYESSIDMLRLDAYADRYEEGLGYCLDHEQHTYSVCMRGARVSELTRRGHNEAAIELALATLAETISPVNEMHLRIGLVRSGFRLGRPEASEWLERLWTLAGGNDETFWILQVAAVAAEAAWLTGDERLVDDRVRAAQARGAEDDPWMYGDLLAQLRRLGLAVEDPGNLPAPYALELAGDDLGAAQRWLELGCPFEEAMALASAGDTEARLRALEIFSGLGSAPATRKVRELLVEEGVRVPAQRGPRAATAAHPAGLTAREAEVLDLLAEHLTNGEIADRLVLSPRTVDRHVSSLLAKLGVSRRSEAAAYATAQSG